MPVLTIYPYLLGQTWVFDDPRTGLKEEAFVLGMTEIISRLVETKAISHAGMGACAAAYSHSPGKPNHYARRRIVGGEIGGEVTHDRAEGRPAEWDQVDRDQICGYSGQRHATRWAKNGIRMKRLASSRIASTRADRIG